MLRDGTGLSQYKRYYLAGADYATQRADVLTLLFAKLRETVFQDPESYFRHFAALSDADADEVARGIWREINGKNLSENILPTRARAALVLHKADDHRVTSVKLRKL